MLGILPEVKYFLWAFCAQGSEMVMERACLQARCEMLPNIWLCWKIICDLPLRQNRKKIVNRKAQILSVQLRFFCLIWFITLSDSHGMHLQISTYPQSCKLEQLQHSTSFPHYLFHRERSSNCPLFWNLESEETQRSPVFLTTSEPPFQHPC